jgi:hypothetical protein
MHEPELVRQVTACREFFRKAPAEPFGVWRLAFGVWRLAFILVSFPKEQYN